MAVDRGLTVVWGQLLSRQLSRSTGFGLLIEVDICMGPVAVQVFELVDWVWAVNRG